MSKEQSRIILQLKNILVRQSHIGTTHILKEFNTGAFEGKEYFDQVHVKTFCNRTISNNHHFKKQKSYEDITCTCCKKRAKESDNTTN